MADVYTSTTQLSSLVQTAVDRYVRAKLRHAPLFRNVVDVRPVQPNMPGNAVTLYIYPDMSASTTALSETTDPDFVGLGDPSSVTINLKTYGAATITTVDLKQFSFSDIPPYQMDQISYNMRDTLDALVRTPLVGGDNSVASTSTITSGDIRETVTLLRDNAAPGRQGDLYWAGIHPRVSHDLKSETGSGGWRETHQYAAPDVFWPGVIGEYEGCFFQESTRLGVVSGTAGTTGAKYPTIVAGAEALAEAISVEPHVEVGTVADKLNRFFPVGWYVIGGWARFREKCLYRIESTSSLDA